MGRNMADLSDASPRLEILRFRDLVLEDSVALRKWKSVIDVVKSASDRLKLKTLLENGDHAEAVLQTLELFTSGGNNLEQLEPILRGLQLNSLADAITGERGLARTGLWFDVGQVALNFQGRTKELNDLHQMMIESQNKGRFTPILIAGLGGVGKTSLARKYAYDNCKLYHSNVVFINGESLDSMKASFLALAATIGLQIDSSSSGREIATKVYKKLRDRKILFIFDNVEEKKDFEQFQPKLARPGSKSEVYVLMTGRRTDLVILPQHKLQLGVLSQNEAVDMIRCQAPYAPLKDVNELARKLQQLPLALQQALAYIRNEELNDRTCVRKYLDEYARSEQRLLADGRFREDYEYSHAVLTTWSVTLSKIVEANQDAVETMLMIAFIRWSDIGGTELEEWMGNTTKRLKILENYSMVEICQIQDMLGSYQVIRMHRLLKRVIRMTLSCRDLIRLADRVLGPRKPPNFDNMERRPILAASLLSALTLAISSIPMFVFRPLVGITFSVFIFFGLSFGYNESWNIDKMYKILQILKGAQKNLDEGQYLRADEELKELPNMPGPDYERMFGLDGGTLEKIIQALKMEVVLKLNANAIQPQWTNRRR